MDPKSAPACVLRVYAVAAAGREIRGRAEVLKELSLKDVPVALQPGPPQLFGQGLELPDIVRLGGHQSLVVRHQTPDEGVVGGILPGLVLAVEKDALDVGVTLTAGVAGVIDPLREVVHAAQTGRDGLHLVFAQLGRLVQKDAVVFHALQPVQIGVAVAVHKMDLAPACGAALRPGLRLHHREAEHLVLVVVFCDPCKLGAQELNVVVDQLRVGAPDDQDPDARIAQSQQLGLRPHGPALSAASGSAEAHVLRPRQKHLLLFFIRPVNV